ncbi:hypothetical protein HHI36_020004 [Cryptolaemus montrouzieri]|uniref:Homeobox domain-containing protein n=1 Tax=Cryptolaemus montrouzieri TaxID=559131 RepID=A0ABD2N8Y0_9CUCU
MDSEVDKLDAYGRSSANIVANNGSKVKPRRRRTTFEQYAKELLEVTFRNNQKPTSSELEILADALCMQLDTVKTWFQNRRAKERKTMNLSHASEAEWKSNDITK